MWGRLIDHCGAYRCDVDAVRAKHTTARVGYIDPRRAARRNAVHAGRAGCPRWNYIANNICGNQVIGHRKMSLGLSCGRTAWRFNLAFSRLVILNGNDTAHIPQQSCVRGHSSANCRSSLTSQTKPARPLSGAATNASPSLDSTASNSVIIPSGTIDEARTAVQRR